MSLIAHFTFHGILNDFLPKAQKNQLITYTCSSAPSVKDAIEALGVPHTEVGGILLNKKPVLFNEPLLADAEVEVFPYDLQQSGQAPYLVQVPLPAPVRYVLDVHLGSLARALRMLGFDTCYETTYTDLEIALISKQEQRIVLTRDIGLLKQRIIDWGYWLRSQHLKEQLQEVMLRYNLSDQFHPFTRCITCNHRIVPVQKEDVLELLPPKTKLYFNEFYQCLGCHKVYWKGSHYKRMQEWVQQVQNSNHSSHLSFLD